MKSKIYILLFALATAFAVTSCSEEEVKPKTLPDSTANGGASYDPIKG